MSDQVDDDTFDDEDDENSSIDEIVEENDDMEIDMKLDSLKPQTDARRRLEQLKEDMALARLLNDELYYFG
ncbi:MAG: hypothetical protein OEZ15_07500 [Gammaproteobacteria bacterium]|nr:hypothetical protein [Gammaproteobacteria bacterium]